MQNESGFWVSLNFGTQHHVLWDIIARDTLFPIAFVTLIVLSLAARALVRADRPNAQLMVAFFLVGCTISAFSDLMSWEPRITGGSPAAHVPAVSMVAVGRSEQAIEALTRWPEAAGFVVLAAGLVCLGNLCRSEAALPTQLALVVYLEAALLVGVALAGVMETGTPYDILSLITGAIVVLVQLLARLALRRTGSVRPTAEPATAVT